MKNCGRCFLPWVVAAITVVVPAFTGCKTGPAYRTPEAPAVNSYTAGSLPEETAAAPAPGGESQRFVSGQEIPSRWWELFQSEQLDRLIRRALSQSPTVTAALAALRQAQENVRAESGALYPKIDANLSAEREKFSPAAFGQTGGGGSTFSLFNASVDVSYTLDIFGGIRSGIEALQAQVDYQSFLVEAAYLTLTSNVVTTAIKEASLRAQIAATEEITAAQEEQLKVVEAQFRLGGVSFSDVLAQRTQVAQTRATLPPLEKELARTRHQLAVLTGIFPGEADTLPEFDLGTLRLPRELPVSLPSALVRQRPDLRASEALLHAASAQIGVATANLYPQITLTGSLGSETTKAGDLFSGGTGIWRLAAGLLQPVFHGGELTARRRAAIAAYDQAAARYKETVLQSFRDVADVLRALDTDARALKAQAEAEAAARDSLDLTRKQFGLGAVSYLVLLNAERQYQQTRIALVQAQAARFSDTAALFQAVGGGWWNREGEEGAPEESGKE